jgi:protein dithiol oxidoreductase (disulfide-forming)
LNPAGVKAERALWLVATLLLGACGGADTPESTANDAAAATEAPPQVDAPELLTSDPGGVESAGRFQLGTHYLRLSPTQPTSSPPDQVEVTEVFWYGCPHCFRFDPLLERWRAKAPEYVSFVRVPAVWNSLLRLHARAFYTAETLGKGAEMHAAFFSEIHEGGNPLDSEAKLQEFFGRFGVDAETFKKTFDSFAVQAKLQHADELNRRYRIGSVPTIVVNGKYTSDATQTGSYEDLLALVDELVAAEHAGQQ